MPEPVLIEGGLSIDDRGQITFVNDFRFSGVKRFYMVENHREGTVRAWHAHRQEQKYVFVTQGAAIVAAVEIDNWEHPSREAKVHRFVLSSRRPAVLCIPEGYANGFMSLTADAKLVFFSTSSLDESRQDDVRYDAHYWDPWKVAER